MKKRTFRGWMVAAGLVALVLAGMDAAHAHHTKVSAGGNTTVGVVGYTAANKSPIVSFVTDYGVVIDCSSASLEGEIERGAEVTVGRTIATIDGSLGCTVAGWFPLTAALSGEVRVRTHPASAGADLNVTITDVQARFRSVPGVPCAFDAFGTLDAVLRPGMGGQDATLELVPAQFDASGNPVSGFDLEIDNALGCLGEFQDRDRMGSGTGWPAPPLSSFEIDTTGVVSHG